MNARGFAQKNIIAVGIALMVIALFIVLFSAISSCQAERGSNARGGYESPLAPTVTDSLLTNAENSNGFRAAQNPNTPEVTYVSYRVKKGDSIIPIATAYGVTQDTLISVNGIRNTRELQIGSYLKIPSMAGILYTVRQDGETIEGIAKKYEVPPEICAEVNHVSFTDPLRAGASIFVPDGELDWVTRAEINGDLFLNPLKGNFKYYSSYYGWRRSPFTGARSFHTGIDLVATRGRPIYPAMDGRVTVAGWSDTYGNYVMVAHHSSYVTLYGHMDSISVGRGAWVTSATRIGTLGNTGLSTGPHLHFMVYKNGKTVNPRTLMK